ncbi:MAG: VTT domain-containing protein [Streptococcaceae bacterium]|jgi:membrane-associated protein|nr:VTT domain-containing protein [Streptococcaceae bacterium]
MLINASIFSFFGQINALFQKFAASPGTEIWIFVVLGLIIFIETGIVIFPFLPGDSVLFFVGSLSAISMKHGGNLYLWLLILVMGAIAFLANLLNFEIGRFFGDAIPKHPLLSRFLKPEYMADAHKFFERWGAWAIFLGRFMPIIRTIVPFTAGAGKMPHRKFILFNLLGGYAWVTVALGAGFLFGNIPFVQKNLELIMLAIVVVSVLPAVIGGIRSYQKRKQTPESPKK